MGSFSHPEGVFMWGLSHILRGCSGGVFLTSLGGVHVGSFSHPEGGSGGVFLTS